MAKHSKPDAVGVPVGVPGVHAPTTEYRAAPEAQTQPTVWVSSVNSTVKNRTPTTPLGPKTLILGVNASGKSALTQSIELALTGCASDIAGRPLVSKDSDLVDLLLAEGEPRLQAVVEISTPAGIMGSASWSCGTEKGDKQGKAAVDLGFIQTTGSTPGAGGVLDPASVFPLRAVREALTAGPDKARNFFLSQVAGGLNPQEIRDRVPADLHTALDYIGFPSATPGAGQGGGLTLGSGSFQGFQAMVVRALLEAVERAGKEARDASKRLTGAETVASDAQAGLAPNPTDVDLENASAKLAIAQRIHLAVSQAASNADAVQRLAERDTEMASLSSDIARWEEEAGRAEYAHASALHAHQAVIGSGALPAVVLQPPTPQPEPPSVTASKATLHLNITEYPGYCFTCGSRVSVEDLVVREQHLLRAFPSQPAAPLPLMSTAVPMAAPTMEQQTWAAVQTAQAWVEHVRTNLARLRNSYTVAATVREELLKQVNLGAAAPPGLTLTRAVEDIATANAERDRLVGLREQWKTVSRAETGIGKFRTDAVQFDALKKALKKVVKELLTGAVDSFVERVQKFLPATDIFGLSLVESEKEVFRVGLRKTAKGSLRAALSGAEQARVWTAIAAALAKPGALQVLIPEDRAFDPQTLGEVLAALAHAPCQVVMTHPTPPTTVPPGWTVVHLQ
jgi:hypothetical protein